MIKLSVKFRAFGITFGNWSEEVTISEFLTPLAKVIPAISQILPIVDGFKYPSHVWFDVRGVKLELI
jgi:hypothetical protein